MTRSRIAALILVGALLAVGCSAEPEPAPTTSSTSTSTPHPGEAVDSPLDVGTPVESGPWTVTVTSVKPDATADVASANRFNAKPAEGEAYATVTVSIEYSGDDPSYLFDVEITLVTDDGVARQQAAAVAPAQADMLTLMQPDAVLTGNLAYLVPTGAMKKPVLLITIDGVRHYVSAS